MNNNYILLLFAVLLLSFNINAQVDIISIGASYSQTTFYNVTSGETESIDIDSWDLAFSNYGTTDAGILINEGSASMGTGLELYLSPTADWSETITDVSEFIPENRLLNPDENWTQGAFNTVKDDMNPFDYGWGLYDPMTNSVVGNKIYVLKKRNGSFVKMQIQSLLDNSYNIVMANLDGSNESTFSVAKDSDNNQGVFFYSIENNQVADITIDFDLIFTRYSALVFGQGELQEYVVTGILSAPNVEIAKADEIDPLYVEEADYADSYTDFAREIGSDWKYFDFAAGWVIEADRAYFIKAKGGNTYKIVFYDFEGSPTGNATLEKFNLGVSTSIFAPELELLSVYPNPAQDFIIFNVEQTNDLEVAIYNQTGALVYETILQGEKLNIPANWNSGLYYVTATVDNKNFLSTLLIQR